MRDRPSPGREPDFNAEKLAMYLLLWAFANLGREESESDAQLVQRRKALLDAERSPGQPRWTVAQIFLRHASGNQVRAVPVKRLGVTHQLFRS